MKILFVLPRSPWPPYAGQARLAYYRAQSLLELGHEVHLFSYAPYLETDRLLDNSSLTDTYKSLTLISVSYTSLLLSLFGQLSQFCFKRVPFCATAWSVSSVVSAFKILLLSEKFDLVHFYSINSFSLWRVCSLMSTEFVVDLVDSMALNLPNRIASSYFLIKPFLWLEFCNISFLESNLPSYEFCKSYITVSRKDSSCLSLYPGFMLLSNSPTLDICNIGVSVPFDLTQSLHKQNTKKIIFFGSLYYYPNIEALEWFVILVFPRLKHLIPGLEFVVAGSRPSKSLISLLQSSDSIKLISDPPSITPLLLSSALSVVPMQSGSGQQFKVLESIASLTPVVSTSFAAEPLGLLDKKHLLIADTPCDFVHAIFTLLNDVELYHNLSIGGKQYVESSFSWKSTCLKLESIYTRQL